jgi:hypothetical protein
MGLALLDPKRGAAHRRTAAAEVTRDPRSPAARSSRPLRAEQIAQSVADQIDAEHQTNSATPGTMITQGEKNM